MSDTITTPIKHLIALMGPTASGKTSLAIQLAKKYETEIISVDSRQFYKEMEIGTAKPTEAQLAEVKHHFINNLSIHQEYTAGHFAKEANSVIDELFKTHDTVIAVGGSTLYFKALLEGIDAFPEITKEAREQVKGIENILGLSGLQKALKEADSDYFKLVDIENPRRVIRALEVCYSVGKPYSSYLKKNKPEAKGYTVIKIGIDVPRSVLYKNIDTRCDEMIANGLLEEVKRLYPYRNLKPLHTVGYTEFFDYLDDKTNLEIAITLFKQHTRNYAKRQMTWLRREEGLEWVEADKVDEFLNNAAKNTGFEH